MRFVPLAGDVDQVNGALKFKQQIPRRQRQLGRADRITARVQDCTAKQVRVAERKAQCHARASRKAGDVYALRIDGVASHDVVGGEQGQGFAPAEQIFVVPRSRGGHVITPKS